MSDSDSKRRRRAIVIAAAALAILFLLSVVFFSPPASRAPVGANAYPLVNDLFGAGAAGVTLDEWRNRLGEFRDYGHYAVPGMSVWTGWTGALRNATPLPDFLAIQVGSKVLRVEATFAMFEGDRERTLRTLADLKYMAQLMSWNRDILIAQLIGVAVDSIATEGLALYALNACETLEDYEKLWAELEALHAAIPKESRDDLVHEAMNRELGLWNRFLLPFKGGAPNLAEAVILHEVVASKFQLLRAAVAARHRLIATGALPGAESDFAPLLPDGLPSDIFAAPPAALRFRIDPANGDLVIFSIGPDGLSNDGALVYDPSNGSTSAGDIVRRVPVEREFPFPREGVRAAAAEDLLAQFPNGLPPDIFAMIPNHPLSVSVGRPVKIYSFGPDLDQKVERRLVFRPGEPPVIPLDDPRDPTVPDPRNGTTSAGDLFIVIPPPR